MARFHSHDDWLSQGAPRVNPSRRKEYIPEYADIAARIVASGGTNPDLAYQLGITIKTLKAWKREHLEFKRACNKGKQQIRGMLVQRGIDAACGYRYTDVKVVGRGRLNSEGKLELLPDQEVRVEKTVREVPPDGRLLMFLVSAIDHQLGSSDWVNIKHIDSHSEHVETHKIDTEQVTAQINKLSAGMRKALKLPDNQPVIEAEFVETQDSGREDDLQVESVPGSPVGSDSQDAG